MPLDTFIFAHMDEAGKTLVKLSQNPTSPAPGFQLLTWSADDNQRAEQNRDVFVQLFGDDVTLPERFKKIIVIQGEDDTFILRLPPKNQAAESLAQLANETNDPKKYGAPEFYDMLTNNKFERYEFFYSRVADYTLRACR